MNNTIPDKAYQWTASEKASPIDEQYYCQTRDTFQARLDKMVRFLLTDAIIAENNVYLLAAIAGEIGNNSFDHNMGNWPDAPGIFFGYESADNTVTVALADRGRGVLETLRRVRPELDSDAAALQVAFTERLSGRAPESRGNGLKFVKESLKEANKHLTFTSKTAKATLNQTMEINEVEKINGCLAVITN